MKSELRHIEEIGFQLVGEWELKNNKIKAKLDKTNITGNTLYAFVCNEIVKYIGKTVRPLKNVYTGMKIQARLSLQTRRVIQTLKKFLKLEKVYLFMPFLIMV